MYVPFIQNSGMFAETLLKQSLDLSRWDTGNAVDMSGMFYNCSSPQLPDGIHLWDVSNVEDFGYTFAHTAFNGDLARWGKNSYLPCILTNLTPP